MTSNTLAGAIADRSPVVPDESNPFWSLTLHAHRPCARIRRGSGEFRRCHGPARFHLHRRGRGGETLLLSTSTLSRVNCQFCE
jgi:hypothetical protein